MERYKILFMVWISHAFIQQMFLETFFNINLFILIGG